MKNKISLLIVALVCLLAFRGDIFARITGTVPTNADIVCWGPDGAEVCVDASGNLIPTTSNDTTLGSSSYPWATIYAYDMTLSDDLTVSDDATVSDDLTVAGDSFKTMLATNTVTDDETISVAGACGGILRLAATADVTTNTTDAFTAPSSSNAGCIIYVVNTGGGTITLDTNSHFIAPSFLGSTVENISLGTNDAIIIGNMGGSWIALSSVVVGN